MLSFMKLLMRGAACLLFVPLCHAAPATPVTVTVTVTETEAEAARADALWQELAQLAQSIRDDRAKEVAIPEARLFRMRALALEFYERYPQDVRTSRLRHTMMFYGGNDLTGQISTAVAEDSYYASAQTREARDIDKQVRELMTLGRDTASDPAKIADQVIGKFNVLHQAIRVQHPPVEQMREIYARLADSPNAEVQRWAAGRQRFLELYDRPLELKLRGFDGGEFDVAQLRGKVVLLDHWHLQCASCIALMPSIQYLYDKYRKHGFEVVGLFRTGGGLAANPDLKAELRKAGDIKHKQGAAWPQALVENESRLDKLAPTSLARTYGFLGNPQLWLLDSSGRMALDVNPTDDFIASRAGQTRLELEIRRLLGLGPEEQTTDSLSARQQ